MFGDNISFCIRTWGQSRKRARPRTKQNTHTHTQKSITERCINQFRVKQQAHYVTAHCAVAICTEMDSDCHKQKPPEETWHPSRHGDAKLFTSPHFRLQEKTKKKQRFPQRGTCKDRCRCCDGGKTGDPLGLLEKRIMSVSEEGQDSQELWHKHYSGNQCRSGARLTRCERKQLWLEDGHWMKTQSLTQSR